MAYATAVSITEKFRMTAGGKAWRVYDIVDTGDVSTIMAADFDLDYIEAIIGHVSKMSMDIASTLVDFMYVSILANGKGVKFASTTFGRHTLTLVGW